MAADDFDSSKYAGEVILTLSPDASIATLTLNRPERLNTMSRTLNMGVMDALDRVAGDDRVRVLIFTGSGRAFSAGGDLKDGGASQGFSDGGTMVVESAVRVLRMNMDSSRLLREMGKVTICAINGACAGAALSWACACDLRFASKNAKFATAFISAGLSGDFGGTWTLPRIVGPAKARELYLLNKKLSAEEALAIGLVSEVLESPAALMSRVGQVAQNLASAAPIALVRIKQNLLASDSELSFTDHLGLEAENHARSGYHLDALEAGASFVQKRPASFAGIGRQREPWEQSKL